MMAKVVRLNETSDLIRWPRSRENVPDYQTFLARRSTNRKTGPIPVSTTTAETCPESCPLRDNGCYADSYPLKGRWDEVTQKKRGDTFEAFLDQVAALPLGQFWRQNQAGDLPGSNDKLDRRACMALAKANTGRRGFTYTHYPATAHNLRVVAEMNRAGFTVNLSGNNAAHADELANLGVAPVVTILPRDYERGRDRDGWTETLADYRARTRDLKTRGGKRITICPETYRDDITCAGCQLCQRMRETIVGFPVHGNSKRKAAMIAEGV
jgi:hypothetical protein